MIARFRTAKFLRSFTRRSILGIALILAITTQSQASATTVTLTINGLNSYTAATRSEKINLKVLTPVTDAGNQTQSITQWLDPSQLRITSLADIIAPAGWVLTYSYDGSTFISTAPTAGGAGTSFKDLRGVRATGSYESGTPQQGLQSSIGQANGAPSGGFINVGGSTGDGYDVIFDDNGHIFNVNHGQSTAIVDCHLRTGERCSGPWPYTLPTANGTFASSLRSSGWVDTVSDELWFNTASSTKLGFACLDISNVATVGFCGGSGATGFVEAATNNLGNCPGILQASYTWDCTFGIAQSNAKIFTWDPQHSAVLCVDVSANSGAGAACSTPSISFATSVNGSATIGAFNPFTGGADIVANGNLIYGVTGGSLAVCIDATTLSACAGWVNPRQMAGGVQRIAKIPDASGNIVATCLLGAATSECFDTSGTSVSPTGIAAFSTAYRAAPINVYYSNSPETQESRVYWTSAKKYLYCWDFATGARCSNFWALNVVNYTINVDPFAPAGSQCVWINSDPGTITALNSLNGNYYCGSNKTEFRASTIVPRMGCSASTAVTGWQNFILTSGMSSGSSAVLSVYDSTGTLIAGWDNKVLNSANSYTVDLTSLPISTTGQTPKFIVSLNSIDQSATPAAKVSILGDSPQLCVSPTLVTGCETYGVVTGSSLLGAAAISITSESSITVGGVTTTTQSAPVTLNAPAAQVSECALATLKGTAWVSSWSGLFPVTPTWDSYPRVPNVTVTLLNSSGVAILLNGQPVTATTGADGRYSFGNLAPGSYQVSFAGPAGSTYTGYIALGGGSGNSFVNPSSTITISTAVTGIVDAGFSNVPANAQADVTTAPLNTATTITPTANDYAGATKSFTVTTVRLCGTAQVPNSCSATTVAIAGQGTYTLNTSTGQITFTPATDWSGTATPVVYQATTNGSVTVSSTYTPTIVPPLALVSDTTSAPWNTVQSSNVLSNDSAAQGTTLVPSSLRLCASGQSTPNCSATTVAIANQGTYAIVNGVVQFTPLSTFGGTATPIYYQVTDSAGVVGATTYTPTVGYPPPPVAVNDTNSGAWNTAQTITPMSNDPAGLTVVGLCPTTQTVAASCTLTSVTVYDSNSNTIGTYSLSGSTVTFTPVITFSGTATPIKYAVKDAYNQAVLATITPTVAAPTGPTATPQALSLLPGASVNFTDVDSGAGALATQGSAALSSSCIVNPANPSSCITSGSFTVAGQGTWSITNGLVTFTADANAPRGTLTQVTYRVTDAAGLTATSTLTPSIPGAPVAVADTSSGPWNTAQSQTVLTNDTASTGATLVTSSLKICGAAQTSPNCSATSVAVANQGTYSVSGGAIVFTPLMSFTGTATPITYQITDSLTQTVSTTYTPTVNPPTAPVAVNDTSVGPLNTTQTKGVIANDTSADASVILDATTVRLCGTSQTAPNCSATSVAIAGQGTYTVNTTTGVVSFAPINNWSGTATPVSYVATANSGQSVSATYTPTIVPPPTVAADTTSGPWNTAQTKDVLANDSASTGTTLVASSLKLCGTSQTAPNCSATTVTVANQGTYSIVSGQIQFTPLSTFAGTATAVTYQVSDALGQAESTIYTPTVAPPAPPVAVNDTSTGAWNTPQTILPLANDPAGLTIVGLCPTTQTVAASCNLASVTVYGANSVTIGTYSLSGSTVTFTPAITFSGTATPINYAVVDGFSQAVIATITPTVAAPTGPTATPQTKYLLPGAAVSFTDVDSGAGALATQGSAALSSSCIVNPANTSSCITSGSFTVTGQGTWSITSGLVTFTADANAVAGTQTVVTYRVTDAAGLTATSTLTPIIPATPTAVADTTSGPWNTAQTKNVLANDSADPSSTIAASTLKICANGVLPLSCATTSVTIANQGTYSISSGAVVFTPLMSFTGTATPITYQVADAYGQLVSTTYTPTVNPPTAPVAVNDSTVGPLNTTQTMAVLANDTSADASVILAANSVRLCGTSQTAPNCSATSVAIAGQGTYTVNTTTGIVSFAPVTNWSGTATPVTYVATANSGQSVSATYTPTIIAAPTATADTSNGAWNMVQTQAVLANDAAATGTTLNTSSLKLCGTSQTSPNCSATSVTVANQGTYAVVSGQITFTPLSTFVGTATAVTYQISDALGQTVSTTYTPTVAYPATPTAVNDTSTGAWNTPQTILPLANDPAGLTIVGLCPLSQTNTASCTLTSVTVTDSNSVTIGTYSLSGSTVTFTPIATFSGTATQIKYAVTDPFAQKVFATITPTVTPPVAPTATPQTKVLLPATSVNFTDVDSGAGALASIGSANFTSSCIVNPANPSSCITSGNFTIVGEGTWSIVNGLVTFAAGSSASTGAQTVVTYRVTDAAGLTATSTLTPIIPGLPVAVPDVSSNVVNTQQTFNVLANDSITGIAVPSTLKLCLPTDTAPNCTQTTLSVTGGAYAVVSGQIVFTPTLDFIGTADPVTYVVADSFGRLTSSTYTPTVTPVPVSPPALPTPKASPTVTPSASPTATPKPLPKPSAKPDLKRGTLNNVIVVAPISNDKKALTPFVPTSLVLCSAECVVPVVDSSATNAAVTPAPIANTATSVKTDTGTWNVDTTTGKVSFMPNLNWYGTASLDYIIFDAAGNPVKSKITVIIPKVQLPGELAYTGAPDLRVPSAIAIVLVLLGLLFLRRPRND